MLVVLARPASKLNARPREQTAETARSGLKLLPSTFYLYLSAGANCFRRSALSGQVRLSPLGQVTFAALHLTGVH